MTEIKTAASDLDRSSDILTPDALTFLAELHRRFADTRNDLLAARTTRRQQVAATHRLDFLPETQSIRDGDWQVAAAPADLVAREVEMTGPTDRKMTINALNSGARVWLADMEDANTPHWRNVIGGQVNLYDAVRRTIIFDSPQGKHYALRSDIDPAVIVMRPRGWHLPERHITFDGAQAVGALVDFGLYFFHNAAELISRGSGPYFYLPKMESHLEARLWNDVFTFAQEYLGIPHGTVRATVLIETIPAAFEMDEILYELRDHASGLNAGRWDYLFSLIKYFRDSGADFVLPDRTAVTMTAPCMQAYAELLVKTCHRRGAHAMGGMAAFIPSRTDAAANEVAFDKVRQDKQREAGIGFDGSWVAHPDLVPLVADVFASALGGAPHQITRQRPDVEVGADDLLNMKATPGAVTETGLRTNVEVSVLYLQAWLAGNGAVGIHNMMEDAATAEISRSQIWQWVHNDVHLPDGRPITRELVHTILKEESAAIEQSIGRQAWDDGFYDKACGLFAEVALADEFVDFLTLPAYDVIG